MGKLINIGFGNLINTDRVLVMIQPDSAPVRRLIQKSRETGKLIDATQGRRTKSVIVTTGETVVLSALTTDTLLIRFNGKAQTINEE
ncbi:MAG: DUF370 domain-containing protein [Lachnospiraceae bacterium]|nr:DUF370 domain-containing protein [Lachnospiraceae bacterium]